MHVGSFSHRLPELSLHLTVEMTFIWPAQETGSQQVYVSSSPQEFVKVPRSSFERVKYWYKGDLNALVQTNAEDKEVRNVKHFLCKDNGLMH